ncbi:serine/threonine-protein kinase HT1-like [Pyrus ussuriensis x Pyrus communis]|uniref:Serine/threonine-protein kinase HT1-like n=1 Tax=Pyrus ussuriensis x Pyrus communis TaxID=2448454 RepID=A0A5N5HNS2_9ROSA|nr:serine/threonine-protein kinase HT1-like [Pyrus ussuriensis x Pyrus communis]
MTCQDLSGSKFLGLVNVLIHKRLLHGAHDPATRPDAVQVRLGQGISGIGSYLLSQSFMQCDLYCLLYLSFLYVYSNVSSMHEITISTNDKPKLLLSEVVKVANFGTVRVHARYGVMTAENGTCRSRGCKGKRDRRKGKSAKVVPNEEKFLSRSVT